MKVNIPTRKYLEQIIKAAAIKCKEETPIQRSKLKTLEQNMNSSDDDPKN